MTNLDFLQLPGTTATVSITRDAAGKLSSIVEGLLTITLNRDSRGTLSSITYTKQGATTTATISRNASGRISSISYAYGFQVFGAILED